MSHPKLEVPIDLKKHLDRLQRIVDSIADQIAMGDGEPQTSEGLESIEALRIGIDHIERSRQTYRDEREAARDDVRRLNERMGTIKGDDDALLEERSMRQRAEAEVEKLNLHVGNLQGLVQQRTDEFMAEYERVEALQTSLAETTSSFADCARKLKLAHEVNDTFRAELQRIQKMPDLEWAQVCAVIAQKFASLARAGYQPDAKELLEALDKGKVYVDRILSEKERLVRDLHSHSAAFRKTEEQLTQVQLLLKGAEDSSDIHRQLIVKQELELLRMRKAASEAAEQIDSMVKQLDQKAVEITKLQEKAREDHAFLMAVLEQKEQLIREKEDLKNQRGEVNRLHNLLTEALVPIGALVLQPPGHNAPEVEEALSRVQDKILAVLKGET